MHKSEDSVAAAKDSRYWLASHQKQNAKAFAVS
jgi:hypothetical protein